VSFDPKCLGIAIKLTMTDGSNGKKPTGVWHFASVTNQTTKD